MSIEKSISPILSNLIAEANFTIEQQETTLKEKLLAVYDQAIKEEFSPKEARKLMEEKIPKVSDRYIREVLPDEAKNLNMKRLPKPKTEDENCGTVPQNDEELEDGIIIPDENRDRSKDNKIEIKTAYEIQEAESSTTSDDDEDQDQEQQENEPFSETQNYINQIREFDTTKQLLVQAREKIEEQDKKINELEIQLAKIDRNQRNENEIKQGTYTLEIKDKIIPLIWKFIPLTEKMEITFDIQKARRMGL